MAEKVKAENKNILKLSKTYDFDGQQISEIELNLENISVADMAQAERMLTMSGEMNPGNILPEFTIPYVIQLAAIATRTPVEFFKTLNFKDAMAIKMRVMSFFGASE